MEHLNHRQKVTIMIAIMAAMLFAALNQTIVGTALPRIIAELGGMEYYSWVFTIYMLTSSITAVLVGKLSDIHGRKPFILWGIIVFVAGSFLSGLSADIFQLITFRGLQGFGAGMIMSTSFTAVGDLFSPRERGRWQGLMSATFGLASVFGPTLGGWIVDNADWHWVFWVFLPFGIVAYVLILKLFPVMKAQEKEPVDYFGSILLTTTIVPMLLAFTWAGNQYEWASAVIIGLFVSALASLFLFIAVEKRAASPVLPLSLFKNSIFTLSNIVGFILGAGMFGAIMFMPLFIQAVIGTSAAASGLIMMPLTLSMVAASALFGQLITKTGKYKGFAVVGLALMTAGMLSLSFMDVNTTNMTAVINMIVVGFGLGISFPIFTLTVQNAVEHKLLGTATAATQLFRQIGGTVGVSILGTVMSTRMTSKMEDLAQESGLAQQGAGLATANPEMAAKMGELQNPQALMDADKLAEIQASLPPEMHGIFQQMLEMLREALSYSLTGVFLTGAVIIGTAVVLTLFLKEIPLRMSNRGNSPEQGKETGTTDKTPIAPQAE